VLAAGARRDFATLSMLGVEAALALVGRDAPVPMRELAAEVRADLVTLGVVLDSLENAGLVSSIQTAVGKRYVLAIGASELRTSDVLDAIRRGPDMELPWREGSAEVRRVLDLHRQAGDTSEHNLTLAELRARADADATIRS
jgi:DNA-binding IscR family transcriptional regulator